MADTISYIKTSVRPAVDSMEGSLGLSLYANAEIGVAGTRVVLGVARGADPFRADGRGRAPAHRRGAPGRGHGERRALPGSGGYEREAPLDTAAGLRLTRMDVDTPRIEDTVECFGATVVPRLADARGFCGALLGWSTGDTGRSISETMWVSRRALAASRGEAAAVRVETVQSTGALIRAVEEYDLVFSTARIGGV